MVIYARNHLCTYARWPRQTELSEFVLPK